jgi:hypothetical protein
VGRRQVIAEALAGVRDRVLGTDRVLQLVAWALAALFIARFTGIVRRN